MHIYRVTYKKYIDEKKYTKEADIVAADFDEAAEKMKKFSMKLEKIIILFVQ